MKWGFSDHLGIRNFLCNVPVVDFGACLTSLMIDFQQYTILSLINQSKFKAIIFDRHRR